MSTRRKILQILSDGAIHSGTEMGQVLGISRAAVNKSIKSLLAMGLDIHCLSGQGYQLLESCAPLDKTIVAHHLGEQGMDVGALHVLDEVDSTSQYLLDLQQHQKVAGHVCIADVQHRGRGRRGRSWVTTPYNNIALSIAWQFRDGPSALAGLSLAAGVAVVEALGELGIQGTGLKWPNDLLWQGRKLGGVLVDIFGEAEGPTLAVLGIGLNVRLSRTDAVAVDQPWVDLYAIAGTIVDRNRLAAQFIKQLLAMFRQFETEGFSSLRERWQSMHIFADKHVRLIQTDREYWGIVEGVDSDGALLIRDDAGKKRRFHSGEISLRSFSEDRS